MAAQLRIWTGGDAPRKTELDRRALQAEPGVVIFDLSMPEPDYDELVKAIFEADSVLVW